MNEILSDTSKICEYKEDKRVKIDFFIYAEEKFNRTIKEVLKKNNLPKEIQSKIESCSSIPARLYGLPKRHKNEMPIHQTLLSILIVS